VTTYHQIVLMEHADLVKKNKRKLCAKCIERSDDKKCRHRPKNIPLLPVTIEGRDCPYFKPKPEVEQVNEEIFEEE